MAAITIVTSMEVHDGMNAFALGIQADRSIDARLPGGVTDKVVFGGGQVAWPGPGLSPAENAATAYAPGTSVTVGIPATGGKSSVRCTRRSSAARALVGEPTMVGQPVS